MNDFDAVQERLTRLHPTLPPTLRKAATYLLENPGEIATQSMRTVAASSGVALPNFARLAKAMGFDKYNELRDVYRRQVQVGGTDGYPARANRLQSSGKASGDQAVWTSFREAAIQNIERVYNHLDAKTASRIATALVKKRRIYIAGMQSSYPFIDYLNYVGGMVLPTIQLLGRRGGILADDLVDIGPKDGLICLAMQPCARGSIQIAELAQDRGAYVCGITDSRASPLAAFSTDIILTPRESPLFFESYVGATAIIELLIGFLTLRAGPAAVDRISQIESDRQRLGEYWDTGQDRSPA